VLFSTGYTRSPIVHHARLDADEHKIGEPNLLTDVNAKVRELDS